MHSSSIETKRKYRIEDLPKFFKERSKDISKVFSNEAVKISTIRSKSITSDTQGLSFELKLLTGADEDISSTILSQINRFIDFFKICLFQGESFKVDIKVPKESRELYNNCYGTDNCKIVEEFISNAPHQLLLQRITITLQTGIKNINLDNLHKIESFLNRGLRRAKNKEQSQTHPDTILAEGKREQRTAQQEDVQNKQIIPIKGSFCYNVASNRKQITRAPVIVAAIHENVSWLKSFFHLPNFFYAAQSFLQQPPELSVQRQKTLTYYPISQNQRCAENDQEMGAIRSHTESFKMMKEKVKKQSLSVIKQAQQKAKAVMEETKNKTLEERFVQVMSEYRDYDSEVYDIIFNSVFNIVYFQDKQLHEILDSDEISKVLEMLKMPQPASKSPFPREYLQKQVCRKKEQLLKLVLGIPTQPSPQLGNVSHEILPNKTENSSSATNKTLPATTFKSSLKTVFSSKETYFCLFLIASSISMLCLWHLPLGKASILKELVPPEKRENIGLVLNIGLPILTALCILSLAYFIYYEYSIESVEQVSENKSLSHA